MPAALPRLLVIDDLLGRVLSKGVNDERKRFCERHRLRDATIGACAETHARPVIACPLAEVVFCRGQLPACSQRDNVVVNDLDGSMKAIREGWQTDGNCQSWALLLLDMCFYTGLVVDDNEVPAGQPEDEKPGQYFGLQILELIDKDPLLSDLPVVILSSMGRREIEQRFSERGALDFIETWKDKTLKSGDDEISRCLAEVGLVPDGSEEDDKYHIVGTSQSLLLALKEARHLAVEDRPILIEGETGTGKESMARFVHHLHPKRRSGPFVAVNCGGLRGDLWMSELFGHTRDAYTGATKARRGKIREAIGGDLFLDEIAHMPWDVQVALLRVIENNVIPTLGEDTNEEPVNVRFICATNEQLATLVAEGRFKEDLLFRLERGGNIIVPPLRLRRSDIPVLTEHFIQRIRVEEGAQAREWKLTDKAMQKLVQYSWPGNVRELQTVVEQAIKQARRLNCIADRHVVFKKRVDPAAHPLPAHGSNIDPGRTEITTFHFPFSDYEILQKIAEGGMGIVSKAMHKRLGHILAIKQIRKARLDDNDHERLSRSVKRFEAEARTAAALQHPNIVRVYDFGEDGDGGFFLAMDYIEGVTLHAKLSEQKDGRIPIRDAASTLLGVVEAVAYAHTCGVIHRDLKPKNILIDATGRPVITDFGLCKSAFSEAGVTQPGEILGTWAYMPPEQLEAGHGIGSQATDIYALGAILYRMITGQPPLSTDEGPINLFSTIDDIKSKRPTSPKTLNPLIDSRLENICLTCLEKDPRNRYATASDLAVELRAYLGLSTDPQEVVRSLAKNPIVAFAGTDSSTPLTEATAAAAALVLGRLHACIPDVASDQERNLADIFEELTGSRATNDVETKTSQLFAGLLNVAPESTRHTIFLSQRLVWAARRAIKRNKSIHKSLGGACLLCQLSSDTAITVLSNSAALVDLFTESNASAESGMLIDLDYSWHVLHRLLTITYPAAADILGFLVMGGQSLETTAFSDHLLAPRVIHAAQVTKLAVELRNLPPILGLDWRVSEEVTFGNLDAETISYYQENYAEIRRFIESAAQNHAGILVCRK